ncbi:VanZ family protein [Parvibaculum sp.]|uniref:VanZ family protein n=1 Tax=Parvibaculum sp. TaxID=2024848 RepID=UPI00391BE8C6
MSLSLLLQSPYARPVAIVAAVAVYLGILVGSLSSELGPPNLFPNSDKLVHMSAWALLSAITVFALREKRVALLGGLGLFASSGAVELIQALVPHRSASWADLLANGIGIALGGALVWMVLRRLGHR